MLTLSFDPPAQSGSTLQHELQRLLWPCFSLGPLFLPQPSILEEASTHICSLVNTSLFGLHVRRRMRGRPRRQSAAPKRLAAYLKRPRLSIPLSGEFCHFKEFLLEHKT